MAVTGGCGFLGQHLIKLLHSHTTNVSCVRILDFMPFSQELGLYAGRELKNPLICMSIVVLFQIGIYPC